MYYTETAVAEVMLTVRDTKLSANPPGTPCETYAYIKVFLKTFELKIIREHYIRLKYEYTMYVFHLQYILFILCVFNARFVNLHRVEKYLLFLYIYYVNIFFYGMKSSDLITTYARPDFSSFRIKLHYTIINNELVN